MNDTDEEIDTAEIEEEEWIEYMKRRTAVAIERMLDRNTEKNEMAIGNENSIATRLAMGKESCRM